MKGARRLKCAPAEDGFAPAGRRIAVVACRERKLDELKHPTLGEKLPHGLFRHAQARLLARRIRGDVLCYRAYAWR